MDCEDNTHMDGVYYRMDEKMFKKPFKNEMRIEVRGGTVVYKVNRWDGVQAPQLHVRHMTSSSLTIDWAAANSLWGSACLQLHETPDCICVARLVACATFGSICQRT